MEKFGRVLISEYRRYKVYFFIALASLLALYSLALFLDKEIVRKMNSEDKFIEYLTAISFFLSALVFFILFFRTKKPIHILFALIFLFGAGEEISWGQRLFDFDTPEIIDANNAQHEFNIHNLKALSSFDSDGIKQGISRYLTVTAIYLLFCFSYGIILPAFLMRFGFFEKLVHTIHLPVPPLLLGLFFLFNYAIFKIIGNLKVLEYNNLHFHSIIDESFELCSGIIFLLISISFLQFIKRPQKKTDTQVT